MPPQLQYLELRDFSPGIFSDWYSLSGAMPTPDGAAQETGTFRCVASVSGGLIPAPRKVQTLRQQLIGSQTSADYPFDLPRMTVIGFKNSSPVHNNNFTYKAQPLYPDMPWVAYSYHVKVSGAFRERATFRGYKVFFSAPTDEATNYPFTSANPGSTFIKDAVSYAGGVGVTADRTIHGIGTIDNTRTNVPNLTFPGYMITVLNFSAAQDSAVQTIIFPDNTAPNADATTFIVFGGVTDVAQFITCHQDRIVAFGNGFNYLYGLDGQAPSNETVMFTDVNDYSTIATQGEIFDADNPGGFAAWASMNASELFLAKNRGGGVIVRGAMENPTVIRLPSLPSVFGTPNIPTATPQGVIYGTRKGVYSWNGGDNAQLISPQLRGFFWNPTDAYDKRTGTYGQFSYLNPYIFAPNNWVYNMAQNGWWRLEDPTIQVYSYWDVSANGRILGVPAYVDATHNYEAISWYDTDLGASSYQWTSQPLQKSLGRILTFREVDLVASGIGTITITLTGLDGATQSVEYPFTSTQPKLLSLPFGIHAHDVTVTILSEAVSDDLPAPRVYRLAMAYYEGVTARDHSS